MLPLFYFRHFVSSVLIATVAFASISMMIRLPGILSFLNTTSRIPFPAGSSCTALTRIWKGVLDTSLGQIRGFQIFPFSSFLLWYEDRPQGPVHTKETFYCYFILTYRLQSLHFESLDDQFFFLVSSKNSA